MSDAVQAPGLYARLKGVEYALVSRGGGWVLQTESATPGFEKAAATKRGGARYERRIAPGEKLDCFRLSHSGTYRKIPVTISPSNQGRVMAITKDPRARDNGFDSFERDEWVKLVSENDRELRITATRTPVPAPWLRSDSGGRR
ncbi:hypothetical protein [Microbacterium sp. NPDC089695]|uniref:hypothetical protein n=1 Tax=Microbacterium sp. NPDC089695 TaxID=3364198 RepID=UPI00381427B2